MVRHGDGPTMPQGAANPKRVSAGDWVLLNYRYPGCCVTQPGRVRTAHPSERPGVCYVAFDPEPRQGEPTDRGARASKRSVQPESINIWDSEDRERKSIASRQF